MNNSAEMLRFRSRFANNSAEMLRFRSRFALALASALGGFGRVTGRQAVGEVSA